MEIIFLGEQEFKKESFEKLNNYEKKIMKNYKKLFMQYKNEVLQKIKFTIAPPFYRIS